MKKSVGIFLLGAALALGLVLAAFITSKYFNNAAKLASIAGALHPDKNGKVVKTVPSYKNGQRINIGRMTKGMYTVGVKTVRGEKKIKFNLK